MAELDYDLLNFDAFFAPNNDEGVDDLWALAATSSVGHEDDLLDTVELEPLSPMKEDPPEEVEVQVKQEPSIKLGLKIDTKLSGSSKDGWLAQYENAKSNGTPTATLPARFALLSTTCVYEPGFTTSPRGKRRISQTVAPPPVVDLAADDDDENEAEEEHGDDEPFMMAGDDYGLPVFTDEEFSAMIESPSKVSSTSTSSPTPSPLRGPNDATTIDPGSLSEHEIPDVINMFNAMYDNSHNFLQTQTQTFDLMGEANNNTTIPPHILAAASQAMFQNAAVHPFSTVNAPPAPTMPTNAIPFDYFTPSGYAAAANQFMDSYGHQIQPFFLNPETLTPVFPGQTQPNANAQLAAAMAMANTAAMNSMRQNMNGTYGVPIAPMQRRPGSMPPVKPAAPLKPRLPVQRSTSATNAAPTTNSKVNRLAITPDIADFKLVQIFHQFCDPVTKVLTLPRFQQLLLNHQVKDDTPGTPGSTNSKRSEDVAVTPDAQTLFTALDINEIGSLDLERFMHSFQICNRCTEAKRRAHQALCASQGQTFSPTALERQLMEDVAPVVVRVVPTRFEGHKVKSCEHYQWTWCEGFEKTGNEKCRGTNRHDKCPKYLANCTLWKHKLPPKSRKPKVLLENVDSPTKKLKYFS